MGVTVAFERERGIVSERGREGVYLTPSTPLLYSAAAREGCSPLRLSVGSRGCTHTHTVGGGGGGGTLDDLDNPKCFSTGNLNTHPFAELNLQTRTGSCA